MSYSKRLHGPRGYNHDPSSHGIFIHGGTCLMHGRNDPFAHSASPNRFSLTFPLVEGDRISSFSKSVNPDHPTFQRALDHAIAMREAIPALAICPIYACTDMIHEKPYMGKLEVQLVSPRIARKKAAVNPQLQAA